MELRARPRHAPYPANPCPAVACTVSTAETMGGGKRDGLSARTATATTASTASAASAAPCSRFRGIFGDQYGKGHFD